MDMLGMKDENFDGDPGVFACCCREIFQGKSLIFQ